MPRPTARAALLALFVAIAGCASTRSTAATPSLESATLRPTQRLDADWRFKREDVAGAAATAFDDSSFERVRVPHTWNVPDGADGGTYHRGPGWYRRAVHVDAASLAEGRRQILRFGAASLVADVYVNGAKLGTHRGGFAAFTFDATDALHAGDNVLAVRVSNAIDKDVTPLRGDFTVYGGLYRDVELITVPSVSITTQDEGASGVYLTPTVDAAGAGVVAARVLVRNATDADASVTLTTTIRDAAGKVVATASSGTRLIAAKPTTIEVKQSLAVPAAHHWNGRADPYLYSATVELARGGKIVDRVTQPLGFRSIAIDADKGFLLNGVPYDLHGVNKHQGRPDVGWADTAVMRAEDFRWIDQLGATFVRLAHYQHADDELDHCDRAGILAWSELSLVDWMTPSPEFRANCEQQLRELIKQQYNHPSVAVWSLYNEPTTSARAGTEAQWVELVTGLNRLAHEMDPTRATTGANTTRKHGPLEWAVDVAGENRYFGWYGAAPSVWTDIVPRLRTQFAGHRIGITEYGAGGSIHQHEAGLVPTTLPVSAPGKWHPEEWQAIVHERAWHEMGGQRWLWCKLIWVMFDFPADHRTEGDHDGFNDKGLVTADRRTPKDAYFFYQANWSTEPVLHVTGRRFTPRRPGATEVKVYSNCDDVTLSVNGKPTPLTADANHVYRATVDLAVGAATVRATGTRAGEPITDECTWTIAAGAATRQTDLAMTRPTTRDAQKPAWEAPPVDPSSNAATTRP